MKSITIRLPDVETAMLVEVQKRNKHFKDIHGWMGRFVMYRLTFFDFDLLLEFSFFL